MFRALNDHLREGGSFRYLIYERLGFEGEYVRLYQAGGMNLSNALQPPDEPPPPAPAAADER